MQQVAKETWVAYQRRLERAGCLRHSAPGLRQVSALLSSAQPFRIRVPQCEPAPKAFGVSGLTLPSFLPSSSFPSFPFVKSLTLVSVRGSKSNSCRNVKQH